MTKNTIWRDKTRIKTKNGRDIGIIRPGTENKCSHELVMIIVICIRLKLDLMKLKEVFGQNNLGKENSQCFKLIIYFLYFYKIKRNSVLLFFFFFLVNVAQISLLEHFKYFILFQTWMVKQFIYLCQMIQPSWYW